MLSAPCDIQPHSLLITAGIGIVLFSSGEGSTEDAQKLACISVYQAEAADRNTIRLFLPGV